jgi:hypothetical protein
MTPKEKAEELVIDKYGSNYPIICKMSSRNMYRSEAKQCALIAVDEIINLLWYTHKNETEYRYWQEVKQEIQAL